MKVLQRYMRGFADPLMTRVTVLLMRLSFLLRGNPIRWMYSDEILKWIDPNWTAETELLERCWNGPVWDVGASVGKYTALLAKANPGTLVYAFESNLNSLYYLGYRMARFRNVVIVPCALTCDGVPGLTTYSPDFLSRPTGPLSHTISVKETIMKYGKPAFAKVDIEGEEFAMFYRDQKVWEGVHLLIEWHTYKMQCRVPDLPYWKCREIVRDNGVQTTRYYEPL